MGSAPQAYVRRLTRGSRTSFYTSFLFLTREKREAIYAIYAFCRAADDAVDRSGEAGPPEPILARWRSEIAACYDGEPGDPISRALAPAIRRFALPRAHFEGILDGVEMDLVRNRYETFEELGEYCHRVASLVGLLCVEVFGYRNPRSRDYARELGLALQLTNILRDLGPDAGADRIYLPREDLRRFGVEEGDLLARRLTPPLRRLLAFEVDRAKERYRRCEALLPPEDRSSLLAARIMAGIYRRVLTEIEGMGYDVFRRRAGPGAARKVGIALKTLLDRRGAPPAEPEGRE